jgi:ABC-type sugar transport system permease subunit
VTTVRRRARNWSTAYSFVLPTLALTTLFSIVPLVLVIQRSLYRGNIFGTNLTFAGLANYADVFRTGGGHSLIPVLIVAMVAQRKIVEGLTIGAVQ